ncbi:MAG: DUF697 domain-containing protein [Saprospiraceae bacterium]
MTDTAETTKSERQEQADKIILQRTLYGAGTGLIPLPMLDAAVLLGVQVYMVRDLARVYDVEFKEHRVTSMITVLVGNAAAVGLFKFVPGLGTFFGGASAAVVGAAATYALGKVFIRHFEQGGTLLDFDAEQSKEFFKQQLEKGKKVVADLKNEATSIIGKSDGSMDTGDPLEKNKALHAKILALQKQVAALSRQPQPAIDPDNLQIVEGIGAKIAAALKAGGITSLQELAQASVEQIKSILKNAKGNFNLATPETWPRQARLAVKGDLKGLKALHDKLIGGKEPA